MSFNRKNLIPAFPALLILSAISITGGQMIKTGDLMGLWGAEQGKNNLLIGFFDSSRCTMDSDNMSNTQNSGKYILTGKNSENVLTLYFENGRSSTDSIIYLVRKSDGDHVILQKPDKTPSGEWDYKWKLTDKQNTVYFCRMERKK